MSNTTNFAFEEVMRMAGGRDTYSSSTLAMIYEECQTNRQIQELAGCHLVVASPEKSQEYLTRLRSTLELVFFIRSDYTN
jgi:hypothetical protein